MKRAIFLLLLITITGFTVQADNTGSLFELLEAKYKEYELLVSEIDKFRCCHCDAEAANIWLETQYNKVVAKEKEIIDLEAELREKATPIWEDTLAVLYQEFITLDSLVSLEHPLGGCPVTQNKIEREKVIERILELESMLSE